MQINSEVMLTALEDHKNPDENIMYPIYARVKRMKFFTLSMNQQEDGFISATTRDNLLTVQFNIFGKPQVTNYPLSSLEKVRIKPFVFGTYFIVLVFRIDGRKRKLEFTAAENVYRTDLEYQQENLAKLMELFKRYTC